METKVKHRDEYEVYNLLIAFQFNFDLFLIQLQLNHHMFHVLMGTLQIEMNQSANQKNQLII